ncbi:uncharacterized protein LOC109793607 [Cajanus cajan]|uniref:Serine/threonine protein phosphatase 7 long form isogeny n=1 Tax=Cajanus cajan TaxID=3821 RepID=A0A151QNM8_CAJCA|nr:uncharacterized protein LOC109793607 [Cajanus cajan]KYP31901.1 Serine/threonine protein phosphatase 7 long form isogeny [Cajanus cajan]
MQAYRDALLWTSCTSIICFAIVEWHQSDRVKLQFRLFQDVPSPPNNLDNLHNIDMRGRQDENWVTRHAQWIDIWNNRREHTLMGHPMQGPLFHTREYMEWYMANSIYFLSVPRLLQDPRTHQQRRTSTTFETGRTSMRSHEETGQHVSNPQYVTPEQNIIDRRHSFATTSEDFFTNLFGVDFRTPSSAQSYMQSLYRPQFGNEPGSSSAPFQHPVVDDEANPSEQQPPRRNPGRNRRRPRCGTGHHYGD